MEIMRKFAHSLLAIALMLTLLPAAIYAQHPQDKDNIPKKEGLTKVEVSKLLYDVGLSNDMLEEYPLEILKELIEVDARLISKGERKKYNLDGEGNNNIGTYTLEEDELELSGDAYEVGSTDWPGHSRILLFARFDWLITPAWMLTDAMSIGYPDNAGFYFKTLNGDITGHYGQFCEQNSSVSEQICETTFQPEDYDPGTGIGQHYDLTSWGTYERFGWMRQYVYVDDDDSGTTNVSIVYGHRYPSIGAPSFGIYPYGFGVNPSISTNTTDPYILTVSWED